MKNLITSLTLMAIAGATAYAQDTAYATSAQVEIEKLSKVEVHKLSHVGGNTFSAIETKAPKRKFVDRWQYFAFPMKVQGKAKGGKIPAFVPELTVTIHVRFKKQTRDGNPIKLSKTITYVDIPLEPKSDMGESKEIYVGAFISPADAFKITAGSKASMKGDLEGQIEAIAYEVKFKDDNCVKAGSKRNFGFGGAKAEGKWWENPRLKSNDAQLLAIGETPFALSYASLFPATKPLIGGAPGGSSATSSGTDTSADSDSE